MKSVTTQVTEISCFVDASGYPGIDEYCVITTLICESSFVNELGSKLQLLRDINQCSDLPMRYSKLVGKKGPRIETAIAWTKAWLYSPECRAYTRVLVIPKDEFDLSYYGNNSETALNRNIVTNLTAALASACNTTNLNISLKLFVDGPENGFCPDNGVFSYLRNGGHDRLKNSKSLRDGQLTSFSVVPVQKRQIEPQGEKRFSQDIVSFADIISGGVGRASRTKEGWNGKTQIAYLMASELSKRDKSFARQQAIEVIEYRPPNTFGAPGYLILKTRKNR